MDTICHLHPQTPCSSSLLCGSICFTRLIQGVLQLDFFFMCLFGCTGLVAALEIFDLHCSMRNIWLSHVGPSSLIRNQTQASCTESLDS